MKNNLRKYRGIHNMTQDELGQKLGVSKAGVSYMEQNSINVESAKQCAEILGENVFAILGKDAFRLLPETEEDKEILINTIRGL